MTGNRPAAAARLRLAGGGVILLAAVALAGCGPGRGEVTGKVTYKGAPVPGGLLTFRPADPRQNSVPAELSQSGTYSVVLPAGEVTVTVDNTGLAPAPEMVVEPPVPLPPEVRKAMAASRPRSAGKSKRSERYVELPTKYQEAETSGLTFTVKRGSQTKDFELTD
jgi:hypothetical protein